ncbi:cytochrome P450 [Trametes gibbosa]|nr:cytochrome P450 [Trametes gibbosa]
MLSDIPLSVWLLSAALGAISWLWLSRRIHAGTDVSSVPMPPGASWIWGHERTVMQASAGEAHIQWLNMLGTTIVRIRGALQTPDILVTGDPAAAMHILQNHPYDYQQGSIIRPLTARILGKSLVWVQEESEHRRMRAIFNPSLTSSSIREAMPEFFSLVRKICDELQVVCLSANDSAATVNMVGWVERATLSMTSRLAFMQDYSQCPEGRAILNIWRKMASAIISPFGTAAFLLLRRFSFLNKVPLKSIKEQFEVRSTIQRQVQEKMADHPVTKDQGADGTDFLTRLMRLHVKGSIGVQELKDHITVFVIGGSETTAQTAAYTIWELARHPEIQARLRTECAQFDGRELTHEELHTRLPLLDAVVRETLRLHPAVPYMERQATKDDVIPLQYPFTTPEGRTISQIAVRAGQTIVVSTPCYNRSDLVWGDSSVFRPARWFDESLPQTSLTSWSGLLSFSTGARHCAGYRLALTEIKVLVYSLIARFAFEDTGDAIKSCVTMSVQPYLAGEAHKGPNLPVRLRALSED